MNTVQRSLAILLAATTLGVAGCASTPSSTEPTPLTGDWSYSKDSTAFDAEVSNGTIDIFLSLEDSRGLYWSGTFEDAATNGDVIVSIADAEALEASLFGSQSDTKEFTFSNGEIEFEFTIMGVVTDIGLLR